MRLKLFLILLLITSFKISWSQKQIQEAQKLSVLHLANMAKKEKNPLVIPRSVYRDGTLKSVTMYDWKSGFFAGNLWYGYELSSSVKLKNQAIKWTKALEPIKFYTGNHDLGFMTYCSFGNAYRLTGEKYYKDVLLTASESLASRYNPVVKAIKSWDDFPAADSVNNYNFPVIIDNMMNLELLFYASKQGGGNRYSDIAINHANTTINNHFRDDFSSYHVVCYDTISGKTIVKETNQGFAHNSAWARGQAWGLYGFIVCYRETKNIKYLEQAQNIANFIINHANLPKDNIPLWDFNVNQVGFKPVFNYQPEKHPIIYRDASAAAIISSALFELSTYPGKHAKKYKKVGLKILKSLSSEKYLALENTNQNFILKHSVGSLPHNKEVDVPLIYADYYFLEAMLRYKALYVNKVLFLSEFLSIKHLYE